MKRYTRGFTLIELLVVIAIIGILASVVLVSLQSARKKGNDTRVISDVQQLRTQFESDNNGADYSASFYPASATNVYITSTSNPTAVATVLADAINNAPTGYTATSTMSSSNSVFGTPGTGTVANSAILVVLNGTGSATAGTWAANSKPTAYAIWGKLSSGGYFCIDSTGNTRNATAVTPVSVAADSFCH
jgi:prepilin-type N-terminal cleavage/methylation domain-containing protein